ncbi:MAG: 2'-5' RNA ligase family protein [Actinomycetota bacterium]
MQRLHLILYATPTGALAQQIEAFFAQVTTELGPTTAQSYPPHLTLTGFFHRRPADLGRVIDEATTVIERHRPVPTEAVRVTGLVSRDDWVGLTVESALLEQATAEFVAEHALVDGDDALRPKDWLHLSLAYGVDALDPYGERAQELIDPATDTGWELGLWERADGGWRRHV